MNRGGAGGNRGGTGKEQERNKGGAGEEQGRYRGGAR